MMMLRRLARVREHHGPPPVGGGRGGDVRVCGATRRSFLAASTLAAGFVYPLRKITGKGTAASYCGREILTVRPVEDTTSTFSNPDMGWTIYETYPVDQSPHGSSTLLTCPGENFPGVDYAAVMFSWFDIEKTEGVYDFTKADFAYDYWRKRGKRMQLHMSTESWLWWNQRNPPAGKGPPDYVVDKLPPHEREMRVSAGIPYVELDARNEFYRKSVAAFLRAVAKHFSGERAVELVDLRGFGVWGEWHNGYIFNNLAEIPLEAKYPLLEKRREDLKGIIDIWSEAFPHNYLALSFSYDPDGPTDYYAGPVDKFDLAYTKHYAGYIRFSAFDYAMTKPNVTLRRDGCGGAIHSNERLFNKRVFNTLAKGPMMSEFFGGYRESLKAYGEQHVRWMVEDALSIHPNYVALMGWQSKDALAFLKEQPELIRRGMTRMGYRLVPTEVTYPALVRAGGKIPIGMRWVNRASGRAMRDYHLHVRLATKSGRPVSEVDVGQLPTSRWIAGREYALQREFPVDGVRPGVYALQAALRDAKSARAINLAIVGFQGGWFPVGKVRII
ncbi:MAG: hypothetical protein ACP5I8_15325 [Phycisphaerae bacterium]